MSGTATAAPATERAAESVIVDTRHSTGALLRPVAVADVTLEPGLLAERRETVRTASIPTQYAQIERTGRIANFRRAAGRIEGDFQGIYFNDSDVYKWLEAAAWSLAGTSDPALDAQLDGIIAEIAAAQRPDGYLNTYFARDRADERWTNPDLHETYCGGHMIQAAVAHYRATGKTTLLDVARRFADHLDATFGPESGGKRFWIDGHEEIELALVELARATGDTRYRDLARYFIDARGHQRLPKPYNGRFGSAYHQDHQPIRETSEIVGHAVRALYYMTGAADLVIEEPDDALDAALDRLWHSATAEKMYVTGGFGARWEGEAFGPPFELPNAAAYAETCASIADTMWAWRRYLHRGAASDLDVLERALYNTVLAGLSRDGEGYFYQNPLEDDGHHRRQPWFGTACCPPNVARTLAALPGYVYATGDDGSIRVNLYAASSATIHRPDRPDVTLRQTTSYPWDGEISIAVDAGDTFALWLRLPGWLTDAPAIRVNGKPVSTGDELGWAVIDRRWSPGDTVHLTLPMPVVRVAANPAVTDDAGRVALQRGPLVYCLEAVDHDGLDVRSVSVATGDNATVSHRPELLGGVTVLALPGRIAARDADWPGGLYAPESSLPTGERDVALTAIPWFAWANRAPGPMAVWLREIPASQ